MKNEQMNRKRTTEFLGKILEEDRLAGMGKYWAKEVSIDYGTKDVKRIDFMQFEPFKFHRRKELYSDYNGMLEKHPRRYEKRKT